MRIEEEEWRLEGCETGIEDDCGRLQGLAPVGVSIRCGDGGREGRIKDSIRLSHAYIDDMRCQVILFIDSRSSSCQEEVGRTKDHNHSTSKQPAVALHHNPLASRTASFSGLKWVQANKEVSIR